MRRLKKELWPAKVTIDNREIAEQVELWLGNSFGAFKDRWNVVYHFEKTDYYFRNDKDALMFSLKWS